MEKLEKQEKQEIELKKDWDGEVQREILRLRRELRRRSEICITERRGTFRSG